jgi:hypothetical protein
MAEPLERRSNRIRKPTVHYDEKVTLAKPTKAPKSAKSATKSTESTEPTEPTQKSKNPTIQPTQVPECNDMVEELCNKTQELDLSGFVVVLWYL